MSYAFSQFEGTSPWLMSRVTNQDGGYPSGVAGVPQVSIWRDGQLQGVYTPTNWTYSASPISDARWRNVSDDLAGYNLGVQADAAWFVQVDRISSHRFVAEVQFRVFRTDMSVVFDIVQLPT